MGTFPATTARLFSKRARRSIQPKVKSLEESLVVHENQSLSERGYRFSHSSQKKLQELQEELQVAILKKAIIYEREYKARTKKSRPELK